MGGPQIEYIVPMDEAEYTNYCFKVKNKNVTMLHNSK